MTPYEQLGFAMPSAAGIGQAVEAMPAGERVISGYFAGQMAGMVYSGWKARKTSAEHNARAISFQEELNQIRNEFGNNKVQAEIDFLRECHTLGMQNQREAALQSCIDRQKEEEFRRFCEKSWNAHFRPQINAVLEEMKQPSTDNAGVPRLKLMIARTPLVADTMDRKGTYSDFCDEFKEEYLLQYNLGMDSIWMRGWECDSVSAMADTMNLHYIMQGLPTVIIYPIKRGDNLSIETATWGYQLGQSHMIMDKTFRIPMSRFEGNKERMSVLMIAAAAYVDDCYRLMLHHSPADSLYKIKGLLQEDELVWELLTNKYRGLIIQSQSVADTMLIGQEEIKKLENTIES